MTVRSLRYVKDGEVDVERTNTLRTRYALNNGLSAIIGKPGKRHYRIIDVDVQGLLVVDYRTKDPSTLSSLTMDESVTLSAAADYLRVETRVLRLHYRHGISVTELNKLKQQ